MRKNILRIIVYAVLLLLFIAAILPLIMSLYLKLYPDRLIYKKGIPQILDKIENDDLSCSISCIGNNVTLSRDQLQTMRVYLQQFFRDSNVTCYVPDKQHKMAPDYIIIYDEKQRYDKQHLLTILVYVMNGNMIEMFYEDETLVFTMEKQDFLQLMSIVMDLYPPSPYIKSMVEAIRHNN
jgi:hypothetical protein